MCSPGQTAHERIRNTEKINVNKEPHVDMIYDFKIKCLRWKPHTGLELCIYIFQLYIRSLKTDQDPAMVKKGLKGF